MSVRCSWCHKYGHNKTTCPDLKKYIEENPNCYEARIANRKKEARKRVVRRCS